MRIHNGGCVYYLAKFAEIFGLTVQDVGHNSAASRSTN
jgi:hypothetical protein